MGHLLRGLLVELGANDVVPRSRLWSTICSADAHVVRAPRVGERRGVGRVVEVVLESVGGHAAWFIGAWARHLQTRAHVGRVTALTLFYAESRICKTQWNAGLEE